MQNTIRLFVAIYPPVELAREWLLRAKATLPPNVQLTHENQIHLTMFFIGETPERELPEVRESVSRSVAGIGPFELKPHKFTMLPETGQPRLLALETDAPSALIELHHRLAQRFAHPGRKKADRFLPHFTLARFPGLLVDRTNKQATSAIVPIDRVHLVRSVLRASGAEHVDDKVFPLQRTA